MVGKIKKNQLVEFHACFFVLENEIKPELNVRRHRRRVSFKVTPKTENYLGFICRRGKNKAKKET